MIEQSDNTAELSQENPTIDATTLFNAALKADQEGIWGDNGAQQDADEAEIVRKAAPATEGDRAPSEKSGEADVKDKAEPSAEQESKLETRERDEKGRFKPKATELDEGEPPDTKYAKAKKEEERQKSLLANFEKEKAEHRAWLEAEKQRIAQEKAQIEQFKQIPRTPDGQPYEFNSKQYAKAADDFYARAKAAMQQGDYDKAAQDLAQAEQCDQAAERVFKAEQQVAQQKAVQQHWGVWQANMDAMLQKEPALADPENPVSKEIDKLLANEPLLEQIPNGFGVAAHIAKLTVQAGEASALSEKVKALEAENADLRRRTGIRPATVAGGIPPAKTTDTMSDRELRSWLIQQSAEADRMPAF